MHKILTPLTVEDRICETHAHGSYQSQKLIIPGSGREIWTQCPKCIKEEDEASARDDALKARQEAFYRRLKQAAIPPRFMNRALDSYLAVQPEQQKALDMSIEYAEQFDDALENGRCLILCGKPGTGKTHLAVGIALYIMRRGRTAMFTSAMNAVRRVRETYGRDNQETERSVIEMFTRPDLLIMDEVGQQFDTDAEKVTLFDLINTRYEQVRPMIVISNQTMSGIQKFLGERAFDRLREGGGRAVQFTWDSYRGGM